ncbi:hypothetical protein [Bdellovibrio sp. HCB288]|uniref:hypothetical protein n=1 Tax=Bdellovibrio sp. HCB288 TaxID=3394355 RepID=UPI0039B59BC4
MLRSDHKNPVLRTIAHSKWALAALILIGLIYFEVRLTDKTLADNRHPASTTTTSLTQ